MYKVCLQVSARFSPGPGVRRMQHNSLIMPDMPLPDSDVVWRFVPRTVVHWLRLLMIHFMHYSAKGNLAQYQIYTFYRAFMSQHHS